MVSIDVVAVIVVKGLLTENGATTRTGVASMDLSEQVVGVVGEDGQNSAPE